MKITPIVSVVIPVRNQGHLIMNAINSIRNQTLKEWELIIVDDGSEMLEVEYIQKLLGKLQDDRIRLYQRSHEGMVAARNFGNEKAKASIIALQDADDLSMPDRLERCVAEINKGADVVYHGLYTNMWDDKLKCISRAYVPAQEFDDKRLLREQYIPGACVFRKSCWDTKPFRQETKHAFDWMMHLDFVFSGFKYKALDIGLYEYVRHEGSASISYERDGRRGKAIETIKKIMKMEYGKS